MNEIELILCSLNRCDRSRLYLEEEATLLDARRLHALEKILKGRVEGAPLSYLLRETAFMGLDLLVRPGVLVPRPETEILVEEVLAALRSLRGTGGGSCRMLDIGTGSGNIAVACARFSEADVRIDAVDISARALACARRNVRRYGLDKKVRVRHSDLFSAFGRPRRIFDAIVSNPPYVAPAEYAGLPRDVRAEPREALVAPDKGLYYYGKIEAGARRFLKAGGYVLLEMDPHQTQGIRRIFGNGAVWTDLRVTKDLNGRERVFGCRLCPQT
ncbi:MAG: peptide chain release factor N(5)-glutamine methyltransferase [Deltaproteobacteria bacterium]